MGADKKKPVYNIKRTSSTGYAGIYYPKDKGKPYRAAIQYPKKKYEFGRFLTLEEAVPTGLVFANAETPSSLHQQISGNVKMDKEKSSERIDGAVAMVMAHDRAIRKEGSTDSVYNEHGIIVI